MSDEITRDELYSAYEKGASVDKYIELRKYITHLQALEVAKLWYVSVASYRRCREFGNNHKTIMRVARQSYFSSEMPSRIFSSTFDFLVQNSVHQNVSLEDAVAARKLDHLHIPNIGGFSLDVILKYTTLDDIVKTWEKVTPNVSQNLRIRMAIVDKKTTARKAAKSLGLL